MKTDIPLPKSVIAQIGPMLSILEAVAFANPDDPALPDKMLRLVDSFSDRAELKQAVSDLKQYYNRVTYSP